MRTYTTDLASSRLCYLLTITRLDGEVFRATTWQQDITIGVTTWTAQAGLRINDIVERNDGRSNSVTFDCSMTDAFIAAIDVGKKKFDFAAVEIFLTDAANPQAADRYFTGVIGDTDYDSRGLASFEARSGYSFPRDVFVRKYHPMCDADLFDSRCGLDVMTYLVSDTIASISADNKIILTTGLAALAAGLSYDFGTVYFSSGYSIGLALKIGSYNAATKEVTFYLPISTLVAAGDTLDAWPGCNKTITNCSAFGNAVNFRGFPYYEGAKATAQNFG